MGTLAQLEPKEVFYYFEEICRIPHGSGNVLQISNYLVEFAKARNLFYIQDEVQNVIIIKEATPGYEKEEPVIIQGHMDMVAVKVPGLDKDMKTEGLDVKVDGDTVYAEGTSLGGDDGIAVAYALAILDSDCLAHPRLEVIITVDEEVGMDGARSIDLSMLKGHRMLNLDSEDEGIFLTSCAGGARVKLYLPVAEVRREGTVYEVSVEGLLGGHSGGEIHKERGNSNSLMGRLLCALTGASKICLMEMEGGLADNAIPRVTRATIIVDSLDEDKVEKAMDQVRREIEVELATKDPNATIVWEKKGKDVYTVMDEESTRQAAAFLTALPNGVQSMSADVKGLVETSLNLGILKLEREEQQLSCEFSVRSSVESSKQALIARLIALAELAGAEFAISGDYPGWTYRVNSPLREKMIKLYEEMYGKTPEVEAIHAGLECGILASKIDDLDCISYGPEMSDIHTTEESLSISSVKRVWEYTTRLLATKDEAK